MKKIIFAFISFLIISTLIIFLINQFKLFSNYMPYSTILGTSIWFKLIFGTYITQIVFAFILILILKKLFTLSYLEEHPALCFSLAAFICIFWGTIRLNQTVCLSESCKSGIGKLVYITGDFYEGELDNYKAHGNGKIFYKNGNIYEGQMFEGLPHGEGELKTSEYKIQSGFFKGQKNGPAKFIYPDGKIIEKRFKEDKELN